VEIPATAEYGKCQERPWSQHRPGPREVSTPNQEANNWQQGQNNTNRPFTQERQSQRAGKEIREPPPSSIVPPELGVGKKEQQQTNSAKKTQRHIGAAVMSLLHVEERSEQNPSPPCSSLQGSRIAAQPKPHQPP